MGMGSIDDVSEPTNPKVPDPIPAPTPPQSGLESKVMTGVSVVKSLTLTNVLILALLVMIAVPAYWFYRIMNDEATFDRFFSYYKEVSAQNVGCALREVKYKGTHLFAISANFASSGVDRYIVSVVLEHEPDRDQLVSYCETLKLIADDIQDDDSVTKLEDAP